MPGKWPNQPQPPFELPKVPMAGRSSHLSCRKAGKGEYSRHMGVIRGFPVKHQI